MRRPTTSERLCGDGPPTPPRQAASAIVARDGAAGVELLLVRRNPAQRFMGGFWVFPGGAVDAGETHRRAAVRELAEEAGIDGVRPAALVEYARWITPELIRTRFDTRFFVARAPDGMQGHVDGGECVALRWTTPAAAVAAYDAGEIELALPTLTLLEGLAGFATVAGLLEHAARGDVRPILPRVVLDGPEARVLLPGELGYEG